MAKIGQVAGPKAGRTHDAGVEYRTGIKDLPTAERPRERLKEHGPSYLSNAELLAVIIRGGTRGENVLALASRLLAEFGGLNGLARAGFAELASRRGLGDAKVAQLQAAFELGRRLLASEPGERPVVRSPADVQRLLLDLAFLEQESLRLVLLDSRNQVVATPEVCRGSLNTNVFPLGELFREAVRHNCAALVVVHNHPSGDPTPSEEDVRMTKQLVEAGRLLDIEVLDHVILGGGRYVSLKERSLGFSG